MEENKTSNINGTGDVVKSDLDFINGEMDNLINNLDRSIDYFDKNTIRQAYNSSEDNNEVYSKMNSIINEYSLAQKTLMEKLKNEAQFVKFAGKAYDDLDKSMQGEANKI